MKSLERRSQHTIGGIFYEQARIKVITQQKKSTNLTKTYAQTDF